MPIAPARRPGRSARPAKPAESRCFRRLLAASFGDSCCARSVAGPGNAGTAAEKMISCMGATATPTQFNYKLYDLQWISNSIVTLPPLLSYPTTRLDQQPPFTVIYRSTLLKWVLGDLERSFLTFCKMGGGGEVCSTRRPALGHVLARTRLGRSTRVTRCASGGERDAPAPPPPPSAKDAVLARIRKAQQYKSERMSSKPQAPLDSTDAAGQGGRRPEQQPQQVAASTSSPSAGSTAGDTLPVSAPLQQQWQQQQRQRPGTASSPDALAAEQRSFRTQEGDANDAASWLKTAAVSTQGTAQQIDMNLSAEQFMLAKEELIRQQEVGVRGCGSVGGGLTGLGGWEELGGWLVVAVVLGGRSWVARWAWAVVLLPWCWAAL